MLWKNVLADELPSDEQEVLISIDGVYYLAIYRSSENGFFISDSKEFIPIKASTIYWLDISDLN